ncbi:RrF2 family transcriptional regulator [Gaoshiqia sediminis]|uniref:Rrf2 family transcriptional regulator n=1 Tax=Gaoshiqia sediminis TaxID=2986998 RepID=A0AA41YB65_9BACT|nr:Rrf2 family transcriptional regulator [Gaoshiqia sediminis]MCW0481452.1 Rrf2 family transcriptional regulator [Gaoshiqia sediminis]
MLSNTCKYAIRALIYLGKFSENGEKIGIKKIAGDLDIPTPFLGKILQNLVKQKILSSTKGPNGGFGLGKPAEEISLYDIVKTIDGEDFFKNCLISLEPCSTNHANGKPCAVHGRFSEVRNELMEFYSQTSIAKIIGDMKGHEELIKL